jgi:transposase
MARALSMDLRSRVLSAIRNGLSCRQAAAHFGVSASSAIRWREREREQGHAAPKLQGGDRRSDRIEARAETILGLVRATPDMTLAEIREALAGQGLSVGIATLWRFFARRRITLKKRRHMRPSRTVPMSWSDDGHGPSGNQASTLGALCSSTRPGPRRP